MLLNHIENSYKYSQWNFEICNFVGTALLLKVIYVKKKKKRQKESVINHDDFKVYKHFKSKKSL